MANDVPNPGSDEALILGCRCAVVDNGHGLNPYRGWDAETGEGLWSIRGDCPLHGWEKRRAPKLDEATTHLDVLAESTRQDDETWKHSCGEDLLSVKVHHPVHDGPFPLSGWGNVVHQDIAYCPSCHERPSESGRPMNPGDYTPTVTIHLKAGQ